MQQSDKFVYTNICIQLYDTIFYMLMDIRVFMTFIFDMHAFQISFWHTVIQYL